MNFLSFNRLFLLAGILASPFIYADYQDRISELEKQMLEVGGRNVSGTFGARFTTGSPFFDEVSWKLYADALLWKASVGGTDFAISTQRLATEKPFTPLTGKVEDISFGWSFGFRVGVGVNFPEDGFDLSLQYTYYKTSETERLRKNLDAGFYGITGFLDPAQSASSVFGLDYDSLSLLLGRRYFLSKSFLVHPSIGIQSTWLKQHQKSQYQFSAQSGELLNFHSSLKDTCSFLGIGPEAYMAIEWHFNNGFYLLNQLTGALLFGYFKVNDLYQADQTQLVNGSMVSSSGKVDLDGNTHFFSPFAELYLGIGYGSYINRRRQFISINLGYEALYYWRQNEFIVQQGALSDSSSPTIFNSSKIQVRRSAEDVSFFGVTLRLSFEY